jgi:hypothetical protein
MRLIAFVHGIGLVSSCSNSNEHVQERKEFWEHALARDIPPGTAHDKVLQWASSHGTHTVETSDHRRIIAELEVIPVTGFKFPCGSWNIQAMVEFGNSSESNRNEVIAVGTCL